MPHRFRHKQHRRWQRMNIPVLTAAPNGILFPRLSNAQPLGSPTMGPTPYAIAVPSPRLCPLRWIFRRSSPSLSLPSHHMRPTGQPASCSRTIKLPKPFPLRGASAFRFDRRCAHVLARCFSLPTDTNGGVWKQKENVMEDRCQPVRSVVCHWATAIADMAT